jgi:Mlc titration factor MtfA (ptsG expression regulator)
LPSGWEASAARLMVPFGLARSELEHLLADAEQLATRKTWEAARGFEVTDEMRVAIATRAALLVLGRSMDDLSRVSSIIVHPTTVVDRTLRQGPLPFLVDDSVQYLHGQSHAGRGPVLLAWDEVRRNIRHSGTGTDVVLHEFAHKLDSADGTFDGTPRLRDAEELRRWVEVCTREYERVRRGDEEWHVDADGTSVRLTPLLRDYAATNPGEFFAVVTEVFFTRPRELRARIPDLYAVFANYYAQDPAIRRDARDQSGV